MSEKLSDRNLEFAALLAETARGMAQTAVNLSERVNVDEVREMKSTLESMARASGVYITENTVGIHRQN